MKLRRLNSDFKVYENNTIPLQRDGEFTVYELKKDGWNTLDAIKRLSGEMGTSPSRFVHAGLKDRHAITTQLVTVAGGMPRNYSLDGLSLEYLGQAARQTSATDIESNRFEIVMRSLSDEEVEFASQALPQIQQVGIANYFDDQRFGSYVPGHPFIAEHWMQGNYEQALWLAFAEPNAADSSFEREQKEILREHWQQWDTCKAKLARSHRRSIVTFLNDRHSDARHSDFKGAWACVNGNLRGLYLSAFQSHLWNLLLDDLFEKHCQPDQFTTMTLKTGQFRVPQSLTTEQRTALTGIELPLPSSRLKPDETPWYDFIETSLQKHGFELKSLKVNYPRDRYFSKAVRSAIVPVMDLSWEFSQDELDPGRSKLNIRFVLPRGCYATMLVKRLTRD